MIGRIACGVVFGLAGAAACSSQGGSDAPVTPTVLAAEGSATDSLPEEENDLFDDEEDSAPDEEQTLPEDEQNSPEQQDSLIDRLLDDLAGLGGDTTPEPGAPPSSGKSCLGGFGDFSTEGPYRVATRDVTIGAQGAYTIFYPTPLDSDCPHPIVAWGNGTFVEGSGVYAFYQEHAASWGIVVIASHNSNVGSGEFHTAGLDYLLEQNKDPSSEFYGKLSPRAGTSGHSQGGAGASAAAIHPNVEAIANVQGSFGQAPDGVAFLCLTGTADIATAGCQLAVESTSSPALFANWDGGDHISTSTLLGYVTGDPGTLQYRRVYTAWFRCFLADDQNACALFQGGADCPVCGEAGWAAIFANNY